MENNRMEDMEMEETMMKQWNGFAASIPGFGHIRNEVPCQDASSAILSPRPAVIVCDGRGSARLSHFGARGAVKMFATQSAILEPLLSRILDSEEDTTDSWDKFCQIMYRTLMQVKLDLAAEHQTTEKEFDFTAAFAIAGQYHIGCFQVGDGSVVLRQDGECITAFDPDKGEFANQTHFLREGGERNGKYHAALFDARVNSGIAVTSDGPQFKMFRLADMMPGEIFRHLFDDLLDGELERRDILTYLTRNDWNTDQRGSDDRSLALLVPPERPAPAVQPEEESVTEPLPDPVVPEVSEAIPAEKEPVAEPAAEPVIPDPAAEPVIPEKSEALPPEKATAAEPVIPEKSEALPPEKATAAESRETAPEKPGSGCETVRTDIDIPKTEAAPETVKWPKGKKKGRKRRGIHTVCYSLLISLLLTGGTLYYQQKQYCRILETEHRIRCRQAVPQIKRQSCTVAAAASPTAGKNSVNSASGNNRANALETGHQG